MFPMDRMMQMASMLNARNPQQASNLLLSQFQNNPMFKRAQQMAAGKSPEEIQQIAKNLCEQRGIDMNQAFEQFRKNFNL